jgi:SAM-dependent methyltransferase
MSIPSEVSSWISRVRDVDWDYSGDQSDSPFSGIHFHPGRLISQIPATLIGLLSKPGDTVLDPYCGSGTSLIEAQRLGRRGIGIDINPISIRTTGAKLFRNRGDRISRLLEGRLMEFLNRDFSSYSASNDHIQTVPSSVQLSKWYHPMTGSQLAAIWAFITRLKGIDRTLFEFCFSGILMTVCSETRHWGYVCDNTRPAELRYVDALAAFERFTLRLAASYRERDELLPPGMRFPLPDFQLLNGDANAMLKGLATGTIDLVVTSPPYLGVIDYVKAQRLPFEWFGYELERFRKAETGARSKRHRTSSVSEYISELNGVMAELGRILKPNGFAAVVIGQSKARAQVLDGYVEQASTWGLKLEEQVVRSIGSNRRQTPRLTEETMFLFRKP